MQTNIKFQSPLYTLYIYKGLRGIYAKADKNLAPPPPPVAERAARVALFRNFF